MRVAGGGGRQSAHIVAISKQEVKLSQTHTMWRRRLLHVVVLRVLCCGVRQQLEVDNGAVVGGSERERAAVYAGLGQPDEGLSAAAGGAVEM